MNICCKGSIYRAGDGESGGGEGVTLSIIIWPFEPPMDIRFPPFVFFFFVSMQFHF